MTGQRARSTNLQRVAVARAAYLARRLATAARDRRLALGLTQAAVAERAGVSQRQVSRLESAAAANADLRMWTVVGAAVGLQLASFFEDAPGADLPRDIQHLTGQNLVLETAGPGGWAGTPEAAVPGDGPRPRSIDVRLSRSTRNEVAVVEIWDLILDGGEVMRGLEAKVIAVQRALPDGWRAQGLLVVRGTRRNRALVTRLASLFAARYPASSAGWIRALRDKDAPMPREPGLVWTDVRGHRLLAARLLAARLRPGAGPPGGRDPRDRSAVPQRTPAHATPSAVPAGGVADAAGPPSFAERRVAQSEVPIDTARIAAITPSETATGIL